MPVAADGLHRRPTRTVAVDLDRAAVDTERSDAVLTMDTAELEEATRPRPSGARPRSVDPRYVQSSPTRGRTISSQPTPNPVAVEVAERYAKALTLSPDAPALPEPRSPRRSRAAMRDRALDSSGRPSGRRRASNPASGAPAPRQRPSRPAPAISESATRPRATAPATAPSVRRPTSQSAASVVRSPASPAIDEATGRRTVTIRGRGAERDYGWAYYDSSRRPSAPVHERPGFRPDRAALWAVFLGLLLVLVAATSAHAAVLVHAAH